GAGAGNPLVGERVVALVAARAGGPPAAHARVGRLLRDVAFLEQRVRGGAVLAMALVALGDHQEALDLLERLRPRGTWLWDQLQYPEFDAMRALPRFHRPVAESRAVGGPR